MPEPRRPVAGLGRQALRTLARRRPDRIGGTETPAPVTPVFVRMLWGRVGSTLLMQLLGTSEDIAFTRKYPFEKRQVAGLLAWAHGLREELPAPGADWLTDERLWWIDPAAFRVQVQGDPMYYAPKPMREHLRRATVRAVWQAFSDTTRIERPQARWYAEKYGGFADDLLDAGVEVRFLDLVRDPRDIWASVRSFDAQRGYYGFGRLADQNEDDYLRSLTTALGRRFTAMRETPRTVQRLIVRYEDLAADLPAQATRIGDWLGVTLDPSAVTGAQESFRHHMTSPDVSASVGRWEHEVDADQQSLLAETLGPLDDFGYGPGRRSDGD